MDKDIKGKPTFLYQVIRFLFRCACAIFYGIVEVSGEENLPPAGTPTLLLFNHSNSLADSVVTISKTKRMVRFCAKDTLWKLPVFGTLIRSSGALPLFRQKEHGGNAKSQNEKTFHAVYDALKNQGSCVGLAAEGRSELVPFVATFKKGPAHIALGALEKMLDEPSGPQEIYIVPIGLTYTHREKFRSSVSVSYGEPLVVDKSYLDKSRFPSNREAATDIIHDMQHRMHEVTLNSPDWKTVSLAMTAVHLFTPLGATISLNEYLTLLNGWVQVLQVGHMDVPVNAQFSDEVPPHLKEFAALQSVSDSNLSAISDLRESLTMYQRVLTDSGLSDERIRRVSLEGVLSPFRIAKRMIFRLLSTIGLSILVAPAMLLWSPFTLLAKRKERKLLDEGYFWADSVTEWKMVIFFAGVVLYLLIFNVTFPLVVLYSWFAIRCYEELIAHLRSFVSLCNMSMTSTLRIEIIAKCRARVKDQLNSISTLLPHKTTDVANALKNRTDSAEKDTKVFQSVWSKWNPRRRTPNHYNEMLRVNTVYKMEYI